MVLLLAGGAAASTPPAAALSSTVVISQVYGGGGNSGAPYTHDYVELFNRGTTSASINGWSIQYASATGAGTFASNPITALSGSVEPGQYYLVRMTSGGSSGQPLPTPDASGTVSMSATGAKVVLVNTTDGLPCNGGPSSPCLPEHWAKIVDLVGWGSANFYEGGGPAPATTSTTAVIRDDEGYAETDDNAADFGLAAPAPRNTASPRCSPPTITTEPDDATAEAGRPASFTAEAAGRPAPTVAWQESRDGGASWQDIPGATETTLAFTAAADQDGYRYRAVFANVAGSATSRAARLTTVRSAPATLRTEALRRFRIRRGRPATFRFRVEYVPAAGATANTHAKVVLKVRDARGHSRYTKVFPQALLNRTLTYRIPRCWLRKGTYRYFIYATLPDGHTQQPVGQARFVIR